MKAKLALLLMLTGTWAMCWAQTAGAASPNVEPSLPSASAGPAVKHIVIEDDGSKIDELRVRGELRHVIVTPKVGLTRRYEIIVGRGGREPAQGTGGADNAVGKRVWNVLEF